VEASRSAADLYAAIELQFHLRLLSTEAPLYCKTSIATTFLSFPHLNDTAQSARII